MSHMKTHVKRPTPEEFQFACDACPKRFARAQALVNHSRVHTGEKPFVCEVCSKAFTHKTTLFKHCLTHGDAKPFQCESCGKSFLVRPILIAHRNSYPKTDLALAQTPPASTQPHPHRRASVQMRHL